MDEGFGRGEEIFHRVFQGHDMAGPLFIDEGENPGEGRTFPASRGTAQEDKAMVQGSGFFQPAFIAIGRKGGKFGKYAKGSGPYASRIVHMNAETMKACGKGTVAGAVLQEIFLFRFRHGFGKKVIQEGRVCSLPELPESPGKADDDGQPFGDMDIRHGGVGSNQFFQIHKFTPLLR